MTFMDTYFRLGIIRLVRRRCRPLQFVIIIFSITLIGATVISIEARARLQPFLTRYSWMLTTMNSASVLNDIDVIGYQSDAISIVKNDSAAIKVRSSYIKPDVNFTSNYELNISGRVRPSIDVTGKVNTTGIEPGGRWHPSHCISRSRIALIIPFANRHRNLKVFIKHIIPFLQRQLIDFQIFVVEQSNFTIFNKAMVMNAGYLEVNKRGSFDCFIFHDVDLLPMDDRHFYSCSGEREDRIITKNWRIGPAHLGSNVDKFRYRIAYKNLFGGATAFTKVQFEKVNGYGLGFWGWGGEDDDMSLRLISKKYNFTRRDQCVAIYRAIKHPRDINNPTGKNRALGTDYRPNEYDHDGLRQTKYTVLSTVYKELYTNIYIALPPPPEVLTSTVALPQPREVIYSTIALPPSRSVLSSTAALSMSPELLSFTVALSFIFLHCTSASIERFYQNYRNFARDCYKAEKSFKRISNKKLETKGQQKTKKSNVKAKAKKTNAEN